MTEPLAQWIADQRVPAILESIRRNPPVVKLYAHGFRSAWRDGLVADQPAYDQHDDRVIALVKISNEYFLRAEADGGRAAALAFGPDIADVIGYAVADRIAA
jgi:hypothetical protein